jgi:hypothetical protein
LGKFWSSAKGLRVLSGGVKKGRKKSKNNAPVTELGRLLVGKSLFGGVKILGGPHKSIYLLVT